MASARRNESYEYMNETEIDEELKCTICTQPFENPVSLLCQHTFCRECIECWLNEYQSCPICRQSDQIISPVNTQIVNNQLDRLLVRCNQCEEMNIQRGNFRDHEEKCLKKCLPCLAADLQCQWKGTREELDNHLSQCPLVQIRPIIDRLQNQLDTSLQIQNELQEKVEFLFAFINQGNIMNKECIKLYSRCQYSIRHQNKSKIIYYCILCENTIQRRDVALHACSLNDQIDCICQNCYEKQYPILEDIVDSDE